jgi:large subunit ribosomal protein L7e
MSEFTPKEMRATLQPRRPGEALKVAQTVLKRRDRNLKANAEKKAKVAKERLKRNQAKKGSLRIVRAERLIKDSLIMMKDKRRLRHKDKKPHKMAGKGRILLIARNSRNGGSKVTKTMLKDMKLTRRNTLVFLPNTDDTASRLKTVKPFVYWGVPTFKLIANLVQKRAMFKDPTQPKAKNMLSDNTLVERHLGDLGVLCTEDIVQTIHQCDKNFDKVNQRLWPIELGEIKKANGMIADRGFTYGDLKKEINTKIQKLLAD